jgi:hypothetical protein
MKAKRKWLFIPILAVIALLIIGIIGGSVYANANSPAPSDNQSTFAAKVAKLLGIDQAKVESALTQARQEMKDEALEARLQKMIDNGKITKEQADQYKTWIKSRPNVPAGIGDQNPFGGRGGKGGCFPGMGGRGFNFNSTPNSTGTN